MKMKLIAAFDFDGTITQKDTLLEFIKFVKGKASFYVGFLLYAPWLVAMTFRLYPNWKVKQKVFAYFFKGIDIEEFNMLCRRFYEEKRKTLFYKEAVSKINEHVNHGDVVVIVSASIDNWVKPFAEYLGVKHVLGTQLQLDTTNRLTGMFATANCYGQEKVNRLRAYFLEIEQCHVVAYGDSRGDRELLTFADESYYKKFRR